MSAVTATLAWCTDRYPDVRFLTRTTDDLETNVPQVRVVGAGGPMRSVLGVEHLILEFFDTDEQAAFAFSNQVVRDMRVNMRGVIGDDVITKVTVDQLPATTPYQNPALTQLVARLTCWIRPTN